MKIHVYFLPLETGLSQRNLYSTDLRWGFALGVTQKRFWIPTCWYSQRKISRWGSWPTQGHNANVFASQWNIGFKLFVHLLLKGMEMLSPLYAVLGFPIKGGGSPDLLDPPLCSCKSFGGHYVYGTIFSKDCQNICQIQSFNDLFGKNGNKTS